MNRRGFFRTIAAAIAGTAVAKVLPVAAPLPSGEPLIVRAFLPELGLESMLSAIDAVIMDRYSRYPPQETMAALKARLLAKWRPERLAAISAS